MRRELEDLRRQLGTMLKYRAKVRDPQALAEIDAAITEARASFARTDDDLSQLAQLLVELGRVPGTVKQRPLPSRHVSRTMTPMRAESREFKIGRAKVTDHPFPAALYARGMTVQDWAQANGLTREKVRSWFIPGAGGRRIPATWAGRIAKDFGVPLDAWPHGVK